MLPLYLDLNTIYIYPWSDIDDNSGVSKKIFVNEIINCDYNEHCECDKYYTIRIETRTEIYFMSFQKATIGKYWISIIKK